MSRPLHLAFRVAPALIAAALLLAPRAAHANSGTAIGVDLDYAHGLNEPGVDGGTGFGVRLGYKLDLMLVQLTPEVGGEYHTFAGDAGAKLAQGMVGGRLQFGKILEPGMYAHLGYGHLSGLEAHSGATLDGGVTLDLTLLPLLDLGVHAGYDGMLKSGDFPAFDSYVIGLHGTLVF